METTNIGTSEVLLYPHTGPLDNNGSMNIGSLATSTNLGVGIITARLGPSTALLVTIIKEMGPVLAKTELHLWEFEEGHCWFSLFDESGINQSAIVRFAFLTCQVTVILYSITGIRQTRPGYIHNTLCSQ